VSTVATSQATARALPFRMARTVLVISVALGAVGVLRPEPSVGSPPPTPSAVLFGSDRDGTDAVYLTNTEGAPAKRIVAGEQPAWCGQNLAFVRSGDVFLARADGTGAQMITRTDATESHPTCSPDGTRIAFSRATLDGGGEADIYSFDLSNHRELRLTAGGMNTQPEWSPDGREIVFATGGHIAVMSDRGSGVRALTRGSGLDANPAWLSDSKILFDRTTGVESHLWITGIGAGTGEQLTHAPGDQQNPALASLNATLPVVFQARDSGHDYRIYATTFDGSVVKQLTSGPGEDTDPAVKGTAQTAISRCECTTVTASPSVAATQANRRRRLLRLTVRWRLRCSGGETSAGKCQGRIALTIPRGSMRFADRSGHRKASRSVTLHCNSSTCSPTTSQAAVELISYAGAPSRTTLLLRRLCQRGEHLASVGNPTKYDLKVDTRGRPVLRLHRGV
jgi:WD40 repeat protein